MFIMFLALGKNFCFGISLNNLHCTLCKKVRNLELSRQAHGNVWNMLLIFVINLHTCIGVLSLLKKIRDFIFKFMINI